MLCRFPVIMGGAAFPCGGCIPCRVNRRRVWTHRIKMEARLHSDCAFVTLTYAPENVPLTPSGKQTLNPQDLQLFMKRLRRRFPKPLRFFAAGEYDDNGRPHYHLVLFGMPTCAYGVSRYSRTRDRCCSQCEFIRDVWGKGFTFLGTVEDYSIRYVCGYVTKKLTGPMAELYGDRYPDFARMSLRPGLGLDALWEVASEWLKLDLERIETDVPTALRNAARKDPLGRYLTHKLRSMVGRDEKAPDAVMAKQAAKLYDLRVAVKADKQQPSFKKAITEKYRGAADALEARQKHIGKGKRS